MLMIARTSLSVLAMAFAATAPAPALQQDPGFSILAPQAEPEPETAEIQPGDALPAGPHLSRDMYLARRGERDPSVLRTRWRVQRLSLDNVLQSEEVRTVEIGDGYVTEPGAAAPTLDFALDRMLTPTRTLGGSAMTNHSIAAHVHRQMDIFAFFTQGGSLDEVTAPGGQTFERFWIEAAIGVRLSPVTLLVSETADGIAARRSETGSVVFGFEPSDDGEAADADLFRRWLRHTVPVHPDALNTMADQTGLPESFTFLVFSPSSPMGRRETWTRISTESGQSDFPWPAAMPAADASIYATPEDMEQPGLRGEASLLPLLASGLNAAAQPGGAPAQQDFLDGAQAAQNRADRTGAYMSLFHASHHFGPCDAQSTAPVCQRLSQATAAGLGDPQFDTIVAALSAMRSDRAAAITGLQPLTHRSDFAGAGANLLSAQALAELRSSGETTFPQLTPMSLFSRSAQADGYAPLTYWHAGRYAAAQGDVELAWMLFDIARCLPAASEIDLLGEADLMADQLRTLAPGYFGPGTTN